MSHGVLGTFQSSLLNAPPIALDALDRSLLIAKVNSIINIFLSRLREPIRISQLRVLTSRTIHFARANLHGFRFHLSQRLGIEQQ